MKRNKILSQGYCLTSIRPMLLYKMNGLEFVWSLSKLHAILEHGGDSKYSIA